MKKKYIIEEKFIAMKDKFMRERVYLVRTYSDGSFISIPLAA